MCKLYIVTGSLKRENALAAIDKANSAFKFGQKDGFGFLAGSKEDVAHGRYERPDGYPGFQTGIIDQITGPKIEIGNFPRKVQTLMVHGRTSTNVKGVENAHPFENDGVFLIHNGVLDWKGSKEEESDKKCDSEQFLDWFANGGDLENMHKLWGGYGAIFIYDSKTNQRMLIKDSTANLYLAKRKFDGFVFATSEYDLKDICKDANIELCSKPIQLPKSIITFDEKGNMDSFTEWEGFASRTYDHLCQSSMGYQSGYTGTPYYSGLQNNNPKKDTIKIPLVEDKKEDKNDVVWEQV